VPVVSLSIEADLCGPVSVGTVSVVRALMTHLALPLDDAAGLVNRCVFDGECVALAAPSLVVAEALLSSLRASQAASRVRAAILA
jgi:hypothetical protein